MQRSPVINCKPMSGLTGKISQVIGPVVDVHFDIVDGQELQLPAIHDALKIKGKFDYSTLQSLSTEARQKLEKIDPETIGQASRIPGISPSDINILLILMGR